MSKKTVKFFLSSAIITTLMIFPVFASELEMQAEEIVEDSEQIEDVIEEVDFIDETCSEDITEEDDFINEICEEIDIEDILLDEENAEELIVKENTILDIDEISTDNIDTDDVVIEESSELSDAVTEESGVATDIPSNLRLEPYVYSDVIIDKNGNKWYKEYCLEWDDISDVWYYDVVKCDVGNYTDDDIVKMLSDSYDEDGSWFDDIFKPRTFSKFAFNADEIGYEYSLYVVARLNDDGYRVSKPLTVKMQSIETLLDNMPVYSSFEALQKKAQEDLYNRKDLVEYYVTDDIYTKYSNYDEKKLYSELLDMDSDQLYQEGSGSDYFADELVYSFKWFDDYAGQYYSIKNNVHILRMTKEFTVDTITEKQEKELTKAIEKLCTKGELSKYRNSSERVIVKKCTEWVHKHCKFAEAKDLYGATVHSAYYKRVANCRGQSLLLYRILREMGIANRIVFRPNPSHMWNIVRIDGKWYSCDATSGKYLMGTKQTSLKGVISATGISGSGYKKILKKVPANDYGSKSVKSYNIRYILNGGTNNKKNPFEFRKSATVKLQSPSRKYYKFNGWYSDKKLTKKVSANMKKVSGNKKLYAKWTAYKYNILFDSNGGVGFMENEKNIACDKLKTLPANTFTKNGYVFAGWATSKMNADGGVVEFLNCGNVLNLTDKNNKTVTLYAVWK